jgi:glutaredoxin-like protein
MFYLTNLEPGIIEKRLQNLKNNIQLFFFTHETDCQYCNTAKRYLEKISSATTKIQLQTYDVTGNHKMVQRYGIKRIPAIAIIGKNNFGIRYYGTPADWESFCFLEDIIDVSKTETLLSVPMKKQLKKIKQPIYLQLFTSPNYPYSRQVIKSVLSAALENDLIHVDIINATEFLDLVKKYNILVIPFTVVNEKFGFYGNLEGEGFIRKIIHLGLNS